MKEASWRKEGLRGVERSDERLAGRKEQWQRGAPVWATQFPCGGLSALVGWSSEAKRGATAGGRCATRPDARKRGDGTFKTGLMAKRRGTGFDRSGRNKDAGDGEWPFGFGEFIKP